ncbi:MAG: DAK2 domain-containing protein [Longimicrobiaceae bacterium]
MATVYLEGSELRSALITACDYVQHRRAELNRINVFPVPDGDTGTNLALTARSIAERLRTHTDPSIGAVAQVAAEASILGARGNCGMILSHYLLGFADAVGSRVRLTVEEFTQVLRAAADHVYRSLERPIEGTMLTIMRETAEEAESSPASDFCELFRRLLERARDALMRTPDLLPALRAAGVVDAGAKGFVHLLEGMLASVSGDPIVALEEAPSFESEPSAIAQVEFDVTEQHRFCTEALVRGPKLPTSDTVRAVLREQGDSLVVIRSGEILKVHIHTDEPEEVFSYLRTLGALVTHKAEDMQVQHEAVGRAAESHIQLARRPVVIVADSALDLPEEVVQAHGIVVVPLALVTGDQVLRDRIDIDAEAFAERLRSGEHPTTSQPTPGAFLEAYSRAAVDGETVVAVLLSGALSGTFASAEAAAKRFEEVPVHLVDSRGASLLQGLLALKAAELGELGCAPEEIASELARVRDRSGILFTVDSFDRLLASGRVGRGRAFIGTLLDIKPILEIDSGGRVVPAARVRGRKNLLPRVMELLEERISSRAGRVRFGVVHAACAEVLEEVSAALRERYGNPEILTAPVTPVLATHLGPGAWGVAYLVED